MIFNEEESVSRRSSSASATCSRTSLRVSRCAQSSVTFGFRDLFPGARRAPGLRGSGTTPRFSDGPLDDRVPTHPSPSQRGFRHLTVVAEPTYSGLQISLCDAGDSDHFTLLLPAHFFPFLLHHISYHSTSPTLILSFFPPLPPAPPPPHHSVCLLSLSHLTR